jgi:MFS transporter, SHS family, sialic acid transporter
VEMLVAYKGWRLMMMLGTLPALLTFFFRMFVPESHSWEAGKAQGHTSGWRSIDLLGVVVGCLGPGLIIWVWSHDTSVLMRLGATLLGLAIATVGFTYPVMQYVSRSHGGRRDSGTAVPEAGPGLDRKHVLGRMFLGAALSAVALLGTWGTTQWAVAWAGQLWEIQSKQLAEAGLSVADYDWLQRHPREWTQMATALGAIVGTIMAAWLGEKLGRRVTYFALCVLSAASVLWLYQYHSQFGLPLLSAAFIAGVCTASFYGWLPLYLPELFPTRVRATGQGFAFNFGRILAAIGTLQMAALLGWFDRFTTVAGLQGGYPVACSSLTVFYVVGMVLIWFAPETKGQPLPE